MKRIQDKIKDLVEPQTFEQVGNYAEDPAQALAAYRFTDVTSDLLARWLDTLAELPAGTGAARALAGARGVGKSHTCGLRRAGGADQPADGEDAHVTASSRGARDGLPGPRFERGTRHFGDELAASLAAFFGGARRSGRGASRRRCCRAASRAGEETMVVVIDTACKTVRARLARRRPSAARWPRPREKRLRGARARRRHRRRRRAKSPSRAYRIDYLDPENSTAGRTVRAAEKPRSATRCGRVRRCARRTRVHWSQARFARSTLTPVAEVEGAPVLCRGSTSAVRRLGGARATRPGARLGCSNSLRRERRRTCATRRVTEPYRPTRADRACTGQLPVMQRIRRG